MNPVFGFCHGDEGLNNIAENIEAGLKAVIASTSTGQGHCWGIKVAQEAILERRFLLFINKKEF